jgi:hypothetical protein
MGFNFRPFAPRTLRRSANVLGPIYGSVLTLQIRRSQLIEHREDWHQALGKRRT